MGKISHQKLKARITGQRSFAQHEYEQMINKRERPITFKEKVYKYLQKRLSDLEITKLYASGNEAVLVKYNQLTSDRRNSGAHDKARGRGD